MDNEVISGLQYKENLQVISGGYVGEEVGSTGLIQNWTDVPAQSGSNTVSYYYRDSDSGNNSRSSRVVIRITDDWTVTANEDRSYTVTVHTVINSIVRDDIRGNPGTTTRNISVRRTKAGRVLWSKSGDNISTAHTIASNIDLGSETFTLAASGGTKSQGTIYLRNNTAGHDGDKTPSAYVDEFWVGVNFRNDLPADYRPGKIRDGNGQWRSHNRTGGKCHIRTSTGILKEMRTADGGVASNNPPYIRHRDGNKNQRLIGQ